MRAIEKPTFLSISNVYDICVNGVANQNKEIELVSIKDTVVIDSKRYDTYAENKMLFILQPLNTLYSESKKEDIKKLYTNQMVSQKKQGRKIYDKLMTLAPLNRCPFCGIGVVTTLDHYLPKGKFPVYAVLPYNLVPSCKDCNTGKGTSVATTCETQTLHPYYDNFTNEQWLFATVIESNPIFIKYFVSPPIDWDDISKCRVKAHFDDYHLAKRFSTETSTILAELKYNFLLYPLSSREIKEELKKQEFVMKKLELNSWKSALYQALAESDWYCDGGFNV